MGGASSKTTVDAALALAAEAALGSHDVHVHVESCPLEVVDVARICSALRQGSTRVKSVRMSRTCFC